MTDKEAERALLKALDDLMAELTPEEIGERLRRRYLAKDRKFHQIDRIVDELKPLIEKVEDYIGDAYRVAALNTELLALQGIRDKARTERYEANKAWITFQNEYKKRLEDERTERTQQGH